MRRLAVTCAAFLVAERTDRNVTVRGLVGLGLLAAVAYLTRAIGLALVLALAFAAWRARPSRRALVGFAVAAIAPIVGWSAWAASRAGAVPEVAADTINRARDAGGRVWAVGTTTVRTLESTCDEEGRVVAGSGSTDLFIRPPYDFRVVDCLLTNFHLPRSTLLMLVAARAGYERTMAAYREAIAGDYRFYSYGDAMMVRSR